MCVTQTQHVENGRCEFIEGEWSRGSEYVSTACLRACLIQEDFISRVAVDAAGPVETVVHGGRALAIAIKRDDVCFVSFIISYFLFLMGCQ